MSPAIFLRRYKPQMRQALPDDEGAEKEGNERILRHHSSPVPLASFFPKNQVELSADFCPGDYHGAHRNTKIAFPRPPRPYMSARTIKTTHADRGEHVFASNRDANTKTTIYWTHTSDCLPDVPLQLASFLCVAASVRNSVRVWEHVEHAN